MSAAPDAAARLMRVKEVFLAALDAPADQRAAVVAAACGADEELRREVETLLAADAGAGSFLGRPPELPAAIADEASAQIGERLGPYELVAHLGDSGMGTVFRARRVDGQFDQDVAIKLVKRGMDTDFVLRRFQAERQILAALDHPNIARLIDGGSSASGLPYFVMELVVGEPIDVYVTRLALPVVARVRLLLAVCAAVQVAHQHLVIHRDLKPANILVTAAGVPKLLDFGIAKLLQPGEGETTAHIKLMTPDYASPEQIRGEPVTTATDVHGLGLLCHELLTGRHAFARAGRQAAAVLRGVLEDEPPRLSEVAAERAARGELPARLSRELAGDLDNIVAMALRKEPGRRYPSAAALADDLRRHLGGLPVVARKDTFGYRAGKFVRRHRWPLLAAAAVAASLLGGVIATGWQARVAGRERARAERRFQDVRRVANALLFEIHDAMADVPGATAARALLVTRATAFLDGLAADAGGEVSLERELVEAYQKLGQVQGNPRGSNLGDLPGARQSYTKALTLTAAVLRRDPSSRWARFESARSHDHLGDTAWAEGDARGSLVELRQALALYERLAAEDPKDLDVRREIAAVSSDIGDSLRQLGDRPAALASYRGALAAQRQLVDVGDRARARRALSITLNKIGDVLLAEGDLASAAASIGFALILREALLAADPQSARAQRDLSTSLGKLGNVLVKAGDPQRALAAFERGLVIDEALAAKDPSNVQARRDVAVSLIKVSDLHTGLGGPSADAHWRAARDGYGRARTLFEELAAHGQALTGDDAVLAEVIQAIALCDRKLAGPSAR